MASERIEDSSEAATGVTNRIEDLLSQLEGHGLKRNGQDDLLARAADADDCGETDSSRRAAEQVFSAG